MSVTEEELPACGKDSEPETTEDAVVRIEAAQAIERMAQQMPTHRAKVCSAVWSVAWWLRVDEDVLAVAAARALLGRELAPGKPPTDSYEAALNLHTAQAHMRILATRNSAVTS